MVHSPWSVIAIIDYDMGNLKSVSKALESVGAQVCVTRDPKKIRSAKKIVLPGVGAFPKCMENLETYGLIDVIKDEIKSGKPFLGICLGLQLLFEESEEFGPVKGLGILKGRVKKFSFGHTDIRTYAPTHMKIPHMGWNQIQKNGISKMLDGIEDGANFYFVHSYYPVPDDKKIMATETEYGVKFCSSIHKDNIFACQFHPEKSQANGLRLLRNFVEL